MFISEDLSLCTTFRKPGTTPYSKYIYKFCKFLISRVYFIKLPQFSMVVPKWHFEICFSIIEYYISLVNTWLLYSLGYYLDEWPIYALSQVDTCTWTSDCLAPGDKECVAVLIGGTWPSGMHWHSAKWYSTLLYISIDLWSQ